MVKACCQSAVTWLMKSTTLLQVFRSARTVVAALWRPLNNSAPPPAGDAVSGSPLTVSTVALEPPFTCVCSVKGRPHQGEVRLSCGQSLYRLLSECLNRLKSWSHAANTEQWAENNSRCTECRIRRAHHVFRKDWAPVGRDIGRQELTCDDMEQQHLSE